MEMPLFFIALSENMEHEIVARWKLGFKIFFDGRSKISVMKL